MLFWLALFDFVFDDDKAIPFKIRVIAIIISDIDEIAIIDKYILKIKAR